MKNFLKSVVALFLFCYGVFGGEEISFVERLYKNILLRPADKEGLEFYSNSLKNGESAARIAKIFFKSEEFRKRNLSSREYVKRLYETLLDREPDKKGYDYWLDMLDRGVLLKEGIFYKFVFSDEFYSLCHSYGIKAYDREDLKEAFVTRFYEKILKREADEEGLRFWKKKISDKSGIESVARYFLKSEEFLSKKLSNEEFVKILYVALLDREADERGLRFWKKEVEKRGRGEVIESFLSSKEFNELSEEILNKKFRIAPFKGIKWYIQLDGDLNLSVDAKLYDLDLFRTPKSVIDDLHEKDKIVMCYFSAGSYENFREDANLFKKSDIGKVLEGWEDERWLDIRSENVLSVMKKRIDLAAKKGCDGIDPDNLDGYANDTGFNLSYEDQLKYNKALARYAHKKGLFIALKNDLDQVGELAVSFDLSVNEQCFEYGECEKLKPFVSLNKPVLQIEYDKKYIKDPLKRKELCKKASDMGFSTLILPLSLNGEFLYDCQDYKIYYHIYFSDPKAPGATKYVNGVDFNITSSLNAAKKSIDVAVYELSLRSVTNALIDAKNRGVRVRVVTDSSNLDWDRIKELKAAGVEVRGDDRSSLMHDKFIIIDGKEIWTGSMNLTYYGVYKHYENIVQIKDEDIAAVYEEEFEELFRGEYKVKNSLSQKIKRGDLEFDIYFAPEDKVLKNAVLPLIKKASESIKFLMFTFTNEEVVKAFEKKIKEGIKISGVLDEGQSNGRYSKYADLLNIGADVKLDGNRYKLHDKVMIIDGNVTFTGSYNFTVSADERNDENALVVKGEEFSKEYLKEFERIYEEAL